MLASSISLKHLFNYLCLVKRSGNVVEFSELALHFEIKTEPSEEDLEVILDYLYNRSVAREKAELESLKGLFNAFRKVSFLAGNMPQEQPEATNIPQVSITKQYYCGIIATVLYSH